jgi:hypothetical protein
MNKEALKDLFDSRIFRLSSELESLHSRYNIIAFSRLTVMAGIIGVLILYLYTSFPILNHILLMALIIFFGWLIVIHKTTKDQIAHKKYLVLINRNEINCIEGNVRSNDEGNVYMDPSHPYTSDLDIFGISSLYQTFCRAETRGGRDLLAQWFSSKAETPEILLRQAAVKELAPLIDWRQDLQAHAMPLNNPEKRKGRLEATEDIRKMKEWLASPSFIIHNSKLLYLVFFIQTATLLAIIAIAIGASSKLLILPVAINVLLTSLHTKKIVKVREMTSQQASYLRSFANILSCIEGKEFSAEKLRFVKQMITTESIPASHKLKHLSNLLYNLDATLNPYFYPVGNYLFLWELFWNYRLEKWKQTNQTCIELWIKGIYELEALASIGSATFIRTDWCFPVLSASPFIVKANEMAHPLIPENKRVSNNLEISGLGKTLVITGSNMSGKSTFLRTIGTNAVLAFSGAPVCAATFEISQMQLYTSMRTQDSLEENTSSFYAELKRLRGLLEIVTLSNPVLYLLDEILKGTNSQDRHKGAIALIYQLTQSNATGLISTHDIELGKVAAKLPEKVSNHSFNSYLKDGILTFDYKINNGICNSFNASELMRQIGIKINDPAIEV